MPSQAIFNARYDWQKRTIDRVKGKLRYKTSDELGTVQDEKLAVVYGVTQKGKTSLILHLMGIEGDKFNEISETLRAGMERGNSSTSTAIEYHCSEDDRYGIAYIGNHSKHEIRFQTTDKEVFKDKLRGVREKVEKSEASEDILNIYIPKCYFSKGISSNVSIVDLPGIDSRNKMESLHTEKLVARYMPIAAVNIIVCQASEIAHLESLKVPGNYDWTGLNQRYILVITHAYSEENIRNYFKQERSKRQVSFAEFVNTKYGEDLKEPLGDNFKVEYYPLDIGDSFESLCNGLKEKQPEDYREVRNLVDDVTEKIKNAILERKGNSLQAIMNRLQEYLDYNILKREEEARLSLDEEKETLEGLEAELEDLEDSIKKTEEALGNADHKDEYESYLRVSKILSDCRENADDRRKALQAHCMSELASQITEHDYINLRGRFVDKEGRFMFNPVNTNDDPDFEKALISVTQGEIEEWNSMEKELVSPDGKALYKLLIEESRLDSEVADFIYKGFKDTRGMVVKRKESEVERKLNECVEEYAGQLVQYLLELTEKNLKSKENGYKTYMRLLYMKRECEENRCIVKNKRCKCNKGIGILETIIKELGEQRKEEEKKINSYRQMAKDEYDAQKERIKGRIMDSRCSDAEKIEYIILLALIESDYNKAMHSGGHYEK